MNGSYVLTAAVLEALLVLPSRRTLEAAVAALAEVCFLFVGICITSSHKYFGIPVPIHQL